MKFPRGGAKTSNHCTSDPENSHPNYPVIPLNKIAPESHVAEEAYRSDIELFLFSLSPTISSRGNYFSFYMDITDHMRGVLISWLVEVHQKYRLQDETFFLMVAILDGYLEREPVTRSRLQLVGITALWIAAKYVETYQVPKLNNLVFICDNTYSQADILTMEGSILTAVGFGILTRPSTLTYLDIIQRHAELQ